MNRVDNVEKISLIRHMLLRPIRQVMFDFSIVLDHFTKFVNVELGFLGNAFYLYDFRNFEDLLLLFKNGKSEFSIKVVCWWDIKLFEVL